MSRFTDYYDNISPSSTDERLMADVKRSAIRHKKNKSALPIAAAAAAVVMTAGTVAAYNWDISAAVKSFFSDKGGIVCDNAMEAEVISSENTFKNLDISVEGVYRDSSFTVFFLDIVRTDGGIFDCTEYSVPDANGNILMLQDGKDFTAKQDYNFHSYNCTSEGNDYIPLRIFMVPDDNDSDGRVTMAACINNAEDVEKVNISMDYFRGRRITGSYFDDNSKIMTEDKYFDTMSGSFSCELAMPGSDKNASERTIRPGTASDIFVYPHTSDAMKLKNIPYSFDVKAITVSNVSVTIELEGKSPETTLYVQPIDIGEVILKDGRTIKFGGYDRPFINSKSFGNFKETELPAEPDKWIFNGSFVLDETIDTDDIAAVKLGSETFYFE